MSTFSFSGLRCFQKVDVEFLVSQLIMGQKRFDQGDSFVHKRAEQHHKSRQKRGQNLLNRSST